MKLIIDGYNLLKTVQNRHQIQRSAFISLLNSYAKKKKHDIMVVFDGGPTSVPTKERDDSITIFYSGKKTADDIISEILELYGEQSNILLISSDMQLKHAARINSIRALDSLLFSYFIVQKKKQKKEIAQSGYLRKLNTEENRELDLLMEHQMPTIKEMDYEREQESKEEWLKELAQGDRILLGILKKL